MFTEKDEERARYLRIELIDHLESQGVCSQKEINAQVNNFFLLKIAQLENEIKSLKEK